MNKAKINALADFIENHPAIEFNMAYHDKCYIAFATLLFRDHNWGTNPLSDDFASAMGMAPYDAYALCIECAWAKPDETDETMPWEPSDEQLGRITREQAVAHLREIAA